MLINEDLSLEHVTEHDIKRFIGFVALASEASRNEFRAEIQFYADGLSNALRDEPPHRRGRLILLQELLRVLDLAPLVEELAPLLREMDEK